MIPGALSTMCLAVATVLNLGINLNISINTADYNVNNAARDAGWDGISPVTINLTIDSGVYVYATTTAKKALTLTALPVGSVVNIVNNGFIVGCGGKGGNAANAIGDNGPGAAGSSGGDAISIGHQVFFASYGTIAGGGGGGGAGHSGIGCGGGGGGGRGYLAVAGGSGGVAYNLNGSTGASGTVNSGGQGGAGYANATGGAGSVTTVGGSAPYVNGASPAAGGAGGGGGGWGAPGGAGGGTTYGGGAGGGAAGRAIVGLSYITWVGTSGTIRGNVL